jgi:hypothetical protein
MDRGDIKAFDRGDTASARESAMGGTPGAVERVREEEGEDDEPVAVSSDRPPPLIPLKIFRTVEVRDVASMGDALRWRRSAAADWGGGGVAVGVDERGAGEAEGVSPGRRVVGGVTGGDEGSVVTVVDDRPEAAPTVGAPYRKVESSSDMATRSMAARAFRYRCSLFLLCTSSEPARSVCFRTDFVGSFGREREGKRAVRSAWSRAN